jgi:hypothetical protein
MLSNTDEPHFPYFISGRAMTTTRKSRREAIHDFGKPEHLHLRVARARAHKLREEESRRRRIEAAIEAFRAHTPNERATLH